MARSENQGLQIAVIIFAFLTIGLSVFTFYFFNQAQSEWESHVAKQKELDEAQAATRKSAGERNALAQVIGGYDPTVSVTDIQTKVKAKVGRVANTLRGPQAADKVQNLETLVSALDNMISTLEQLKSQVKDETVQRSDLKAKLESAQENYKTDVASTKTKYDGQVNNFMTRIGELDGTEKQHMAEVGRLTGELQKKRDELATMVATKTKEIAGIQGELEKAIAMAAEAKRLQYERENYVFERPDGMIVAVNPKEDIVWIDVGRADELRPNLKFTVFTRGEDNVHKRKPKGVIEVRRFLGQTMAEARIVRSELKDPILTGDVIYTPTWTPREPEHYVLNGVFDLNGDKKPDSDLVLTLIRMGGGVVDKELTITTRYLLLGERPSDNAAGGEFDKLKGQAADLNIKIMTVSEFLDYTGARDLLRRTTGLDALTRDPEDIVAVMKDREQKDAFKRRPPSNEARRLEPGAQPRGPKAASEPPRRLRPGGAGQGIGGEAPPDRR